MWQHLSLFIVNIMKEDHSKVFNTLHAGQFCMLFCRLPFSKSTFSKSSFKNAIRVSNSLNPNQAQHFVGPDMGPNCLQKLSAVNTSRQRVKFNNLLCTSKSSR